MRTFRWLVAAGLLMAATGCVETNGYPGTSYGGYPSGYGYSSGYGYPSSGYYGSNYGYYSQPTYYRPAPQVVTQTRYVPVPVPTSSPRPYPRSSWGSRDDDRDGIPNRYDRDRNNDGIPDRQQRWNRPG
jgi:hypothetical protein